MQQVHRFLTNEQIGSDELIGCISKPLLLGHQNSFQMFCDSTLDSQSLHRQQQDP